MFFIYSPKNGLKFKNAVNDQHFISTFWDKCVQTLFNKKIEFCGDLEVRIVKKLVSGKQVFCVFMTNILNLQIFTFAKRTKTAKRVSLGGKVKMQNIPCDFSKNPNVTKKMQVFIFLE